MAPFSNPGFKLINLAIALAAFYISGCASVQPPGGGPKDTQAPKILSESPKNLSTNFTSKEVLIEFDEFIKLSNEFKEISISPAFVRAPIYKIKKNVLSIRFQDSLEKNTTYTINFGKAIIDYNAGNIFRNHTYVFSTGNVIDSLSISGNVTNTLTKKPEIDIPVFIIPVRLDSIFGKRPANIFTTTDSAGNFILRNLKADTYRIYALREQGGDRIYNSSTEEIAFRTDPIVLTENVTEIALETFKENAAAFITEDRRIEPDSRIFLTFNQPITDPSLRILNPEDLDSRKTVEFSAQGDTALLWLPELTFDSLQVAIRGNATNLDTVTLRRNRRDEYTRVLSVRDNALSGISSLNPLILTFAAPVTAFDAQKITLLDDTIAQTGLQITKDSRSLRTYTLAFPWKKGHSYNLRLAENAFTGPFGGNKYYTNRFRISDTDIYGNLTLVVKVPDSQNYILELIRDEKDIVRTTPVSGDNKIEYRTIAAGKYNVRIVYDANKNGKWDTGNVRRSIQPERVWNFPKSIPIRSNWDQEEPITIPQLP